MNREQPSFAVRSSHKILNNQLEVILKENSVPSTEEGMEEERTIKEKTIEPTKSSSQGMVIRTTNISVEDFY